MMSVSPTARTFRHGLVVGAGLVVACVILIAAFAGLAPDVFHRFEALGDYQLKPWIFAAPLPFELAAVLALAPGFRSRPAWLGLLAGVCGVLAIGVAIGYAVLLGVIGSVRY